MWLQTKGVLEQGGIPVILKLSVKEGIWHWQSFSLATPENTEEEIPDRICKSLKAYSDKHPTLEATENKH